MGKKAYTAEIRLQAESMRKEGKTYAQIREKVHVSKSTLSSWLGEKFSGIFDRQAQLTHLKRARLLSAARLRGEKIARDTVSAARGAATAALLPVNDISFQKSLIAILYWAEGAKNGGTLKFVNTDPRLAKLYITLLRSCFPIDERKIRIRLHLHYYHDKKKSVQFWSRLLRVPPTQFGKLYVKKRSATKKFRQNFMGICFISYSDTPLIKEVLGLAYAIPDKIVFPCPR